MADKMRAPLSGSMLLQDRKKDLHIWVVDETGNPLFPCLISNHNIIATNIKLFPVQPLLLRTRGGVGHQNPPGKF